MHSQSYPTGLDCTLLEEVCPSELLKLANLIHHFQDNGKVICTSWIKAAAGLHDAHGQSALNQCEM